MTRGRAGTRTRGDTGTRTRTGGDEKEDEGRGRTGAMEENGDAAREQAGTACLCALALLLDSNYKTM